MANALLGDSYISSQPYEVWITAAGDSYDRYVGELSEDGITSRLTPQGKPIKGNSFGSERSIDAVHQGDTLFLELALEEANRKHANYLIHPSADILGASAPDLDPGGSAAAGDGGIMRLPGLLQVNTWGFGIKLKPKWGAAVPKLDNNYEASGGTGIVRWFKCCTLANGSDVVTSFKADLMVIPLVIEVYPYLDATNNTYRLWEWTTGVSEEP